MQKQEQRLYYLDNLKILLAILVISVHLALAYGPEVWWFYKSNLESPMLLVYYEVLSTICMGLFFLISAYFIPLSYDKKGSSKFLRSRFKLYIIPIILGLFFIVLPLHYIYNINFRHNDYNNFFEYTKHIFFGIGGKPKNWYDKWLTVWPDFKFAHLWFLEHLLIYSSVYTLIKKFNKKPIIKINENTMPPSAITILVCIAIMSIVTFIIRIWFPLDCWGGLFGFIQMEYDNVPKYIMFVCIGILGYRFNWFSIFSKSQGKKWLILGIILLILTFMGKGKFNFIVAKGGLNWESFIWSSWDCLMCMSLNIGLIVSFRESLNFTSPFIKLLSKNTFGVYIFHVPIITFMQFGLASINLPIGVKFGMELILGTVLSFTIAHLIRCLCNSNMYFKKFFVKELIKIDTELSNPLEPSI